MEISGYNTALGPGCGTSTHSAEFFCGPGVKLGLCSALDTSGNKEEQLKTPAYKLLYSYCLLVSEAV